MNLSEVIDSSYREPPKKCTKLWSTFKAQRTSCYLFIKQSHVCNSSSVMVAHFILLGLMHFYNCRCCSYCSLPDSDDVFRRVCERVCVYTFVGFEKGLKNLSFEPARVIQDA